MEEQLASTEHRNVDARKLEEQMTVAERRSGELKVQRNEARMRIKKLEEELHHMKHKVNDYKEKSERKKVICVILYGTYLF